MEKKFINAWLDELSEKYSNVNDADGLELVALVRDSIDASKNNIELWMWNSLRNIMRDIDRNTLAELRCQLTTIGMTLPETSGSGGGPARYRKPANDQPQEPPVTDHVPVHRPEETGLSSSVANVIKHIDSTLEYNLHCDLTIALVGRFIRKFREWISEQPWETIANPPALLAPAARETPAASETPANDDVIDAKIKHIRDVRDAINPTAYNFVRDMYAEEWGLYKIQVELTKLLAEKRGPDLKPLLDALSECVATGELEGLSTEEIAEDYGAMGKLIIAANALRDNAQTNE